MKNVIRLEQRNAYQCRLARHASARSLVVESTIPPLTAIIVNLDSGGGYQNTMTTDYYLHLVEESFARSS